MIVPAMPEDAEDPRHRDEHDLERDEAGEQHQAEDHLVAAEPPFGEHVAVERAEHRRDRDGRDHHQDRVQEVRRLRPVALDADLGLAQA